MIWLLLVLVAYFLNAVSTLISKWLLIKSIPEPVVFTFYIGVLNLVALLLIPFGFYFPGMNAVIIAIFSGIFFGLGFYFLARALRIDQASQVAPMVGGLQPIFVLLFAFWFLPERLSGGEYLGILFLILGSLIMAYEFSRRRIFTEGIKDIILSSVFFGFSYALLKLVYLQQGFVSGFIWTRIGTFLLVIALAALPGNWRKIRDNLKGTGEKVKGIFVLAQILGAASFLIIAYAISLGPVTIINAMQGVQYALLFLLVIILARRYPHLLDEPLSKKIIIQKSIAIGLIMLGLVFVI